MKTAPIHETPEGARPTDIALRLRWRADEEVGPRGRPNMLDEAADEIERLRKIVKAVRAALSD